MHTIYYDGVCALCNGTIRFVVARDRRDVFRFAALQGQHGREALAARGRDPDVLDTIVVIADDGTLYDKASAAFFILRELGGPWSVVAWLRFLPTALLNWGYDLVAKRRYRTFGKLDACPVPPVEQRHKFLHD